MRVLEKIVNKVPMKIMIVAVIMILGGAFYAIDNATQKIASANVESLDKQQEELDQLNKDAIKLQKEVEEARIKKEQLIREMYPIKVAQQQGYSAEVGKAIIRSSKEFGVKTELIMGMIYSESTWRNLPPNECGATGLMQVTYNTARNVAEDLGMDKNNIDLNDPSTNIRLGTYIISNLIRQYGDINTALTAYNMGEGGMKDYVAYYGTSRSGYARTVLYHSSKYEQD